MKIKAAKHQQLSARLTLTVTIGLLLPVGSPAAAQIAGEVMIPAYGAQLNVAPPGGPIAVIAHVQVPRIGLKGGDASSGTTSFVDLDGRTVEFQWRLSAETTPARVRETAKGCTQQLLELHRAKHRHERGLAHAFGQCMDSAGLTLAGFRIVMPQDYHFVVKHLAREGGIGGTSAVSKPDVHLGVVAEDLRACFVKSQEASRPVETGVVTSSLGETSFSSIRPLLVLLDQCMQDSGYAVRPLHR